MLKAEKRRDRAYEVYTSSTCIFDGSGINSVAGCVSAIDCATSVRRTSPATGCGYGTRHILHMLSVNARNAQMRLRSDRRTLFDIYSPRRVVLQRLRRVMRAYAFGTQVLVVPFVFITFLPLAVIVSTAEGVCAVCGKGFLRKLFVCPGALLFVFGLLMLGAAVGWLIINYLPVL